jgi:hypothetical protein
MRRNPQTTVPSSVPTDSGGVSMSLIFSVIVIVAVILLLRRALGAVTTRGATAGPGRPRPDLSVTQLTGTLRSGRLPAPVSVSFPLQPGETCVGTVDADVEQWLEGDGAYTKKYVAWAGGLPGLAIGGAINAVGNSRRKAAAAREAAERWRLIGSYRVYVTTQRIAIEGGSEWHEIWLQDLRRLERTETALELQTVGQPPTRLHAAPTAYWYVLLRRLAFNELPSSQAGV